MDVSKDADCKDDGDVCNGLPYCDKSSGACKINPATVIVCPSAADTACTKNLCDKVKGTCAATALADGAACTDDNACTDLTSCQQGQCKGATLVPCDDANVCTTDTCDLKTGCAHAANSLACPDADPCTASETCVAKNCVVQGKPCDDGNPCTADGCSGGPCTHQPVAAACGDGNPCTSADHCAAGACTGNAKDCDDNSPCTVDFCNSSSGACVNSAITGACNDGSACTSGDVCAGGKCTGTAKVCNDGNACTADGCDAVSGACTFAASNEGGACGGNKACWSGSCATCPLGTAGSAVDDAGVATVACGALAPLWGNRADGPTTLQPGSDSTVQDTQTQLDWDKGTAAKAMTWSEALAWCDAHVQAGKSDWRLPTIVELTTLVDRGADKPAIALALFPGTPSTHFWSSTPTQGGSDGAWTVDFGAGGATQINGLDAAHQVRCVRGWTAAKGARFKVASDGLTVADAWTQLTWQRTAPVDGVAWGAAKAYCAALSLSGGGWRLPWAVELQGLVDYQQSTPAIDGAAFPGTPAAWFWTARGLVGSATLAWNIYFGVGDATADNTASLYKVRCVR